MNAETFTAFSQAQIIGSARSVPSNGRLLKLHYLVSQLVGFLFQAPAPNRLEPKAGLEPAATRVSSDNPILRPVEMQKGIGQEPVLEARFSPNEKVYPSDLRSEECAHLAKDVILAIDEDVVSRVGEHNNTSAGNLSAEMFEFLLVIFPLCFENLQRVFSLRLGQRFSRVDDFLLTDGEKRKRWRVNFAVIGRGRISGFHHRVYCSAPLLPE